VLGRHNIERRVAFFPSPRLCEAYRLAEQQCKAEQQAYRQAIEEILARTGARKAEAAIKPAREAQDECSRKEAELRRPVDAGRCNKIFCR